MKSNGTYLCYTTYASNQFLDIRVSLSQANGLTRSQLWNFGIVCFQQNFSQEVVMHTSDNSLVEVHLLWEKRILQVFAVGRVEGPGPRIPPLLLGVSEALPCHDALCLTPVAVPETRGAADHGEVREAAVIVVRQDDEASHVVKGKVRVYGSRLYECRDNLLPECDPEGRHSESREVMQLVLGGYEDASTQ